MTSFLLRFTSAIAICYLMLGLSSPSFGQPHLQQTSRWGIDTLRLKSFLRDPTGDLFDHNGYESKVGILAKVSALESPVYVIDTTFVWGLYDTSRHIYSFGPTGRMATDLRQEFRAGQFINVERRTWTPDMHGNTLSDTYEYWLDGQWVSTLRTTYTYDESGRQTGNLNELFTNGQWMNNGRATIAYDSRGKMLVYLSEQWLNGAWVYSGRDSYTYNTQGAMTSNLCELYRNGQWRNEGRETYSLDAEGRDTSSLWEVWKNGQWMNGVHRRRTYDTLGNELTLVMLRWSDSTWQNEARFTRTYDRNHNKLSELQESGTDNGWVNFSRDTYAYDVSGRPTHSFHEWWSDGRWMNRARTGYTYDGRGNRTLATREFWNDSTWVLADGGPVVVSDKLNNSYGSFWGYRVAFHYTLMDAVSEGSSPLKEYALFQNYPNPFNPSTTIRYALPERSHVTLTIYTLLGQKVTELVNGEIEAGYHEVEFNASDLASGVYFYRLTAGSTVEAKKLLLLR